MAFNPMMLMKLKTKLEGFNARHPKFKMFFADAFGKMAQDDVLEIKVKKPDGREIRTNIRVTGEDVELLQDLASMVSSSAQNYQK